jgi:hypothetical protein
MIRVTEFQFRRRGFQSRDVVNRRTIHHAAEMSSTGFSLWGFVLAKTNPQAEACAT